MLPLFWHKIDDAVADYAVGYSICQWSRSNVRLDEGDVGVRMATSITACEGNHVLCVQHVSKLIHSRLLEQGLTHLVHINANGLASRPDLLRCNEHIETTTAAIVDNHFALMRCHKDCSSPMSDGIGQVFEAHLFQIRQSKRVAAAKPKVGFVWYGL
jgi:hypothetical protein